MRRPELAPLSKVVVRTPRKWRKVVSAALFEAGAGAIEEAAGGDLVVYTASLEEAHGIARRAAESLREVAPRISSVSFDVQVDEGSDWASNWTAHLRQIALTDHVVIQPFWDETAAPPGARRILFEPRMSFGDGAHVTTRLAARAIERVCQERPGLSVLDYGSGTGVLAFVALLSGAAFAHGVDIDPVSVEAARQNAALNGLGDRATFGLPGARAPTARFEVVVANLEVPILLGLASELARHAERAKRLIVTGFLGDKAAEISAAFASQFRVERREVEDEWAVLELVPC